MSRILPFTSLMFLLTIAFSLFCAGTQSQDTGQVEFITIEEELALGDELRSYTVKHLNIIRNRTLNHYFSDMAKQLGDVSHWRGLSYTIFIVNEPDVNHFSLPGGNIYLFRGLIEAAETQDDMAAIIAHEIAHLSRRDAVNRLAIKYGFAFAAQDVIGENPEIAQHVISSLYKEGTILDYPHKNEYIADAYALEYLDDAGYNPYGLLNMLQTLQHIQKTNPQHLQLLLYTHPSTTSRIRQVRKDIKQLEVAKELPTADATFLELKTLLETIPR